MAQPLLIFWCASFLLPVLKKQYANNMNLILKDPNAKKNGWE